MDLSQYFQDAAFLRVFSVISYLPVALYAESLRVNTALVYSISSSMALPFPMTGCIKDLDRLWNIKQQDILSDFDAKRFHVASLRHGNNFPLLNKALLEAAQVIGRRSHIDASEDYTRLTTVNISWIVPLKENRSNIPIVISKFVTGIEILFLIAAAVVFFFCQLYYSAALLSCFAVGTILLVILQHFTTLVFSKQLEVEQDKVKKAPNTGALDVQIIAEHWNTSDLDVLVGYSTQLHALTNIPIRINGWWKVVWISRMIAILLMLQAAALASLIGRSDIQIVGSSIWLFCYILLSLLARITTRLRPDLVLDRQPATVIRSQPIHFTSRRSALAFIMSLPKTEGEAGRWDWLDVFMPRNARRKTWEDEMVKRGLLSQSGQGADPVSPSSEVSKTSSEVTKTLCEVKKARELENFKTSMASFYESLDKARNGADRVVV